jgi:hypothetical protein
VRGAPGLQGGQVSEIIKCTFKFPNADTLLTGKASA